jgi:hypothetical protein
VIINGRIFVNPGELRTPVTLQTRTVVDQQEGWATLAADVKVKWEAAHGQEGVQAAMTMGGATATVSMRYKAGFDQTCAILKGTDRYEVVAPVEDVRERHEWMVVTVRMMRPG